MLIALKRQNQVRSQPKCKAFYCNQSSEEILKHSCAISSYHTVLLWELRNASGEGVETVAGTSPVHLCFVKFRVSFSH